MEQDTYSVGDFAASLMDAAHAVLPYVGAAVGAGLIVMALAWGVRAGIRFVGGGGPSVDDMQAMYRKHEG